VVKWQQDRLVEQFRRECRRVSAGLADPVSLAGRLWDLLAQWDKVAPAVVPRLLAHVPGVAMERFAAACRAAASPDFRLLPWLQEGQRMTWGELEADAGLRSGQVRSWAAEFCRVLASAEGSSRAEPSAAPDRGGIATSRGSTSS
jgi:hypothetical protein